MATAKDFASSSKGGDVDFKTQDIKGVREEKGIVIGIVKVNSHPASMGNLSVLVPTFDDGTASGPKGRSQWRQVRYCTPFYSRTEVQGSGDNTLVTKNTSGMVYPCPDIGTKVLCFFPEGRNQDGFWFACAPDTYIMQSLPEPAFTENITTQPGQIRGTKAPGGEFNDIDFKTDKPGNENYLKPKRAFDFYTHSILKTQGIDQDEIRGLTSSNYMRESPSELFGITTKGRRVDKTGRDLKDNTSLISKLKNNADLSKSDADAVEGRVARKHGHSLVMDDGDIEGNNNLIRFKTAAGHQILLHDTEDIIYIGNSKGTSWVQMDAEGQLDIYSRSNINLRSRNINMHADSSIKMHAGNNIQIVAGRTLQLEGGMLAHMYSDGQAQMFGAKSIDIKSGSALNIDGSKVGIKAGGDMGLQAGCISLNGFAGGAAKQKAAIKSTKPDTTRNGKGFWEATATLQTTVDRVPTHEPFADHKTTTQESVLRSVQVGNIPTSGTVILDKLKQSVKTPSSGLSLIKALTNKESVSPASILKQLDVNINVEKLSSGVIKNLAAATVEKVGSGGLLSFVDPITKAVGKYGADTISLVNNGFVRPETFFNGELDNPRMWTNKLGIDGLQSFLGAGNIQEDIFLTDIVDDYQNAVLSGAIQDDDAEEDIAGMVMVTRATNAEVAGDFREGRTIDPKPIIGTVNIASADGMIKELTSWYQKGVSAASMVGTRDNLGYTNNWYDNNYQEELDNSW
jgi:hypothetical protein|tara:strand:+ start:5388 stop:7604 length:2217 start_codon:yes stop_codon:yes gene_type:complete